ncbi:nuclear transport factor 2 family protein [Caulobacter sp. S45]|uniref:nuclear transport factor 2 family protein n=1 Tax=Caulobacter sp. S45 TaxID=1641861 RepID=UPI001577655D|nr:nuclear transport factor 2 family protein [Caulobacter sp. S45]
MTVTAQSFIDALHRLEGERDVDGIAALFAPDAVISNPLVENQGEEGPAAFWGAYRKSFDDIRSEFSTILEQGGQIALEWRSTGAAKGRPFAYEGVSILEAGDKVTAFRTYFDSAKLGRELTGQG